MSTKNLRGILIGAGAVSTYHLQAWSQIPEASIVAIADPDSDAVTHRGKEFGITYQHIYPSIEAALEGEEKIDFVDIATPPNTHFNLVKLAAENGLQITCQKPFAYSLKEASQMIELCDRANVVLNINENWRWRAWYREIKAILEREEIGVPYYAKFFIHSDVWVNRERKSKLNYRSHGTFMEWGIHHVDLMRYLFGEVESVYGRFHNVLGKDAQFEQSALIVLNFHSKLVAYLDLNAASFLPWGNVNKYGPMVEDMRIEGNRGGIVLSPAPKGGDTIQIVTEEKQVERPVYSGTPLSVYQASYTSAHQHFIDCLLSGKMPETQAKDNYETLAVTLAAYQSAETNQVVKINNYKRGVS